MNEGPIKSPESSGEWYVGNSCRLKDDLDSDLLEAVKDYFKAGEVYQVYYVGEDYSDGSVVLWVGPDGLEFDSSDIEEMARWNVNDFESSSISRKIKPISSKHLEKVSN